MPAFLFFALPLFYYWEIKLLKPFVLLIPSYSFSNAAGQIVLWLDFDTFPDLIAAAKPIGAANFIQFLPVQKRKAIEENTT